MRFITINKFMHTMLFSFIFLMSGAKRPKLLQFILVFELQVGLFKNIIFNNE